MFSSSSSQSLLLLIGIAFTSVITSSIKGCIAWQIQNQNQNQNKNYYYYGRRSRSRSRSQCHHHQSPRYYGTAAAANNNVQQQQQQQQPLLELSASTLDDQEIEPQEHSVLKDSSSSSSSSSSLSVLNGVKEFETWFSNISGSKCDSNIIHTSFNNGNLRGLGMMTTTTTTTSSDTSNNNKSKRTCWMTIPRSIILQSDFNDNDWDTQLAHSLWKEVIKNNSGSSGSGSGSGSSTSSSSTSTSNIGGYVSLLTRGCSNIQSSVNDNSNSNDIPPYTAPDALRHWTKEEMDVLLLVKSNNKDDKDDKGQQLIDIQIRQEKLWKDKYNNLKTKTKTTDDDDNGIMMTWKQFEWAMEAVHSRAFKGDFGIIGRGSGSGSGSGSGLLLPVTMGLPIISAIIGYIYYVQLHGQHDEVLLGLAALAAIPSIINIFTINGGNGSSSSSLSNPVAVLLPLIDSANHNENADSLIEYNPLTDSFNLSGSELKCLGVKEKIVDDDTEENNGNGGSSSSSSSRTKQQLYISYGKKSSTELLLNYGFLNNNENDNDNDDDEDVSSSDDDDDASTTARRKKLAEKFIALN